MWLFYWRKVILEIYGQCAIFIYLIKWSFFTLETLEFYTRVIIIYPFWNVLSAFDSFIVNDELVSKSKILRSVFFIFSLSYDHLFLSNCAVSVYIEGNTVLYNNATYFLSTTPINVSFALFSVVSAMTLSQITFAESAPKALNVCCKRLGMSRPCREVERSTFLGYRPVQWIVHWSVEQGRSEKKTRSLLISCKIVDFQWITLTSGKHGDMRSFLQPAYLKQTTWSRASTYTLTYIVLK